MAQQGKSRTSTAGSLRVIRTSPAQVQPRRDTRTKSGAHRQRTNAQAASHKQERAPSRRNKIANIVKEYDFTILIVLLALVGFGLVMVYSSSYYYAQSKFGDGQYYFKKQIMGAVLGFILLIILANFDYHKLKKLKWPAIVLAVVLLGLVLLPSFQANKNGASRWLNIAGISLQPSEIAKFAVILFMSATMASNQKYIKRFSVGVLPNLILLGLVCGLIILQPNLSTVISICLLGFIMMYAGGAKMSHLIPLALFAVVVLVYLMFSADYRMKRYQIFLNPWEDPKGDGYQLIQSLYAIGGGGLFGAGIGASRQKLLFLPYGESDFIFSVIAEETGLFGVLILLVLFALLLWRGIKTAITARDQFGALLATGIVSIIAIQVIIHIGVATGSMPPTGVTLPFISAGNSSLTIFTGSIGILLNISKYAKQ